MISVPSLSSAQEEQSSAPAAGARISAAPPTGAQGRRRGEGEPEYTPAAGAKDLKSVLFNWAWYTGMLRSTEERDLLMTLVYRGQGHHPSGRAALQRDDVPIRHQLPGVR